MKHPSPFSPMTTTQPVRRTLHILGFLPLLFVLGGCLYRPSMKTQTFAFTAPTTAATNGALSDRVLSIRTFQVAPPFDGRSLVYRTEDYSYQRDPYAEFLSSPSQELETSIGGILSGYGCFGTVVTLGSAAAPDTLVDINISQLYGDIRKPGSPFAVLALQVIFVEAKNGIPGKVILQRSYSRQIPVQSATADAFMKGWNEALAEIFAEVASDFRSRKDSKAGLESTFESRMRPEPHEN